LMAADGWLTCWSLGRAQMGTTGQLGNDRCAASRGTQWGEAGGFLLLVLMCSSLVGVWCCGAMESPCSRQRVASWSPGAIDVCCGTCACQGERPSWNRGRPHLQCRRHPRHGQPGCCRANTPAWLLSWCADVLVCAELLNRDEAAACRGHPSSSRCVQSMVFGNTATRAEAPA
jgi:hypothetical protein